ncbi:hypothetical protein F5Y10DRAFT_249897 [Nemania abortiva]|nr:hypothetical protein F5Y10DRAFT_249897 [Nemania abortiva]
MPGIWICSLFFFRLSFSTGIGCCTSCGPFVGSLSRCATSITLLRIAWGRLRVLRNCCVIRFHRERCDDLQV